MITEQARRQKADQVMAQMVRTIHAKFPDLAVDLYDTGPEREDGMLVVHIPDPDMKETIRNLVRDLQAHATFDEQVHIYLSTELTEEGWAKVEVEDLHRHLQIVPIVDELLTALKASLPHIQPKVIYSPPRSGQVRIELDDVAEDAELTEICRLGLSRKFNVFASSRNHRAQLHYAYSESEGDSLL